jgi:dTDP-4-dehydrorhamnose reductase
MKEKILITGASSYVGARLHYDLRQKYDTIGTYNTNQLSNRFLHLDTTRKDDVKELINKIRPNIIVHVAANPSAKWCDKHPDEAKSLNETATESVVSAAGDVNVKVIFFSSFSATDTSNVYGRTKAESEKIVKAMDNWIILRPSLIIGYSPNTTNDRPFNRFLKNIDEKKPAVYDTSWKFQPSYLGHISEVIALVIDKEINAQTIPIAVPDLKSRFDIARDILTEFNIEVTPEDKQDKTPVLKDDLSKLRELGLPIYKYDEVIKNCIEEIKHRDLFRL